jgi:hypothetical protein
MTNNTPNLREAVVSLVTKHGFYSAKETTDAIMSLLDSEISKREREAVDGYVKRIVTHAIRYGDAKAMRLLKREFNEAQLKQQETQ